VTAAPISTSSTVSSTSSLLLIVNVLYGTVRKKSNHTALETAASTPASRMPNAATATITTTSSRAAFALSKLSRNGVSSAQTAGGTSNEPASTRLR
jgi:hypothetical protein